MSTKGWIGVDLDGTLAEYHGWTDGEIGKPIPTMVARVKRWLADGKDVRIFTARISPFGRPRCTTAQCDGRVHLEGGWGERLVECPATKRVMDEQKDLILTWCVAHIGQELPMTFAKDFAMVELWDDRCVAVENNTGRSFSWGLGADADFCCTPVGEPTCVNRFRSSTAAG